MEMWPLKEDGNLLKHVTVPQGEVNTERHQGSLEGGKENYVSVMGTTPRITQVKLNSSFYL